VKISDKKTGGLGKVSRSGRRSSSSKAEIVESASGVSSSDTVEISSHAQAIEAIRELVAATPDIRSEQVARISDLLRQGKYKIDYQKVAESFIKHVIAEELARKKEPVD
jgi:flagellar biosynthesis anti-sigma factor FlgM